MGISHDQRYFWHYPCSFLLQRSFYKSGNKINSSWVLLGGGGGGYLCSLSQWYFLLVVEGMCNKLKNTHSDQVVMEKREGKVGSFVSARRRVQLHTSVCEVHLKKRGLGHKLPLQFWILLADLTNHDIFLCYTVDNAHTVQSMQMKIVCKVLVHNCTIFLCSLDVRNMIHTEIQRWIQGSSSWVTN